LECDDVSTKEWYTYTAKSSSFKQLVTFNIGT